MGSVVSTPCAVPKPVGAILDFTPASRTPESKALQSLLTAAASHNVTTVYGMGGVGKTTILRALANHPAVLRTFSHGVHLLQLGQEATLADLQRKLIRVARVTCGDFSHSFQQLIADDATRLEAVIQLVSHLAAMRLLLIFDDVWMTADIFRWFMTIVTQVCNLETSSFKLLVSTRSKNIAMESSVAILVQPVQSVGVSAEHILCHYADVDHSSLSDLTSVNRKALAVILQKCAGLPLALAIAGRGVKSLMLHDSHHDTQSAWQRYRIRLEENNQLLAGATMHHTGLFISIQSSLNVLQNTWNVPHISLHHVFRSLCILKKQMLIPITVLKHMWRAMTHGTLIADFLRESSLVTIVPMQDGTEMLRVHDLVHDICVGLAQREGEYESWHELLLEPYATELRDGSTSTCRAWWTLNCDDGYIEDNLVRHLLSAGHVEEVVQLLTDYRWLEKLNDNDNQIPFQQVISDIALLRVKLVEHDKDLTRLAEDLDLIAKTMEMCMVPYCMNNRSECAFQLYGRLSSLRSTSLLATRLLWTIEQYARKPWIRPRRAVLKSAESNLRRVIPFRYEAWCMEMTGNKNEIVVETKDGTLRVINMRDGMDRQFQSRHMGRVLTICADPSARQMYTCDENGEVIVWRNEERVQSFSVNCLESNEWITAMLLQQPKHMIMSTTTGRLLLLDVAAEHITKICKAHDNGISCIAIGENDHLLASASWDRTMRFWDSRTLDSIGQTHQSQHGVIYCVQFSTNGSLMAFSSRDGSIHIWNMHNRQPICGPLTAHKNRVKAIAFNAACDVLYTASPAQILVWDVSNPSHGVSLCHTFEDSRMRAVRSLRVSDDDDELLALTDEGLFVWDAKEAPVGDVASGEMEYTAIVDVGRIAKSADDETVVCYDAKRNCFDIRSVVDVAEGRYQPLITCRPPFELYSCHVAVSNERHLVAFTQGECDVYVLDVASEEVRYEFSGHSAANTAQYVEHMHVDSSNILTVYMSCRDLHDAWSTDCISWDLDTGEQVKHGRAVVDEATDHEVQLSCEQLSYAVKAGRGGVSNTIGTLENRAKHTLHIRRWSELWILRDDGVVNVLEYITEENPRRSISQEPILPRISNRAHENSNSQAGSSTEQEPDYTVFLSHAGPDKHTLALKVYKRLKKAGLRVFFDMTELQAGDEAPEKMQRAMETAQIFVVIASPEYPARVWTMKELQQAIERFDRAKQNGTIGPIIIPAFYRLTIEQCRSAALLEMTDEHGVNVFTRDGFFRRLVRHDATDLSLDMVITYLKRLPHFTGIENLTAAGNNAADDQKREHYADRIAVAVIDASKRHALQMRARSQTSCPQDIPRAN